MYRGWWLDSTVRCRLGATTMTRSFTLGLFWMVICFWRPCSVLKCSRGPRFQKEWCSCQRSRQRVRRFIGISVRFSSCTVMSGRPKRPRCQDREIVCVHRRLNDWSRVENSFDSDIHCIEFLIGKHLCADHLS